MPGLKRKSHKKELRGNIIILVYAFISSVLYMHTTSHTTHLFFKTKYFTNYLSNYIKSVGMTYLLSNGCNTGKSALPDMYARHPRASVDISGNVRFPMLQLICYTSDEAAVFIC